MKLAEKILLVLALIVFVLQAFIDYGFKLFFLLGLLIGLFYIIGGYKLFKSLTEKRFLPILSGVAIGVSFVTLALCIVNFDFRENDWVILLTIPNSILLFYLGYRLFFWKLKTVRTRKVKTTFLKSLVLFLFLGFYIYQPSSSGLLQNTYVLLRNQDPKIKKNIQAYRLKLEAIEELKNDNCEEAYVKSKKAYKLLFEFLGYEVNELLIKTNNSEISYAPNPSFHTKKIREIKSEEQGYYSVYYNSLVCFAEKKYDSYNFEKALDYYLRADAIVEYFKPKNEYWINERVLSLNDLAKTTEKLNDPKKAIEFYTEAIEIYKSKYGKIDESVAYLLNDMAAILKSKNAFPQAKLIYKQTIKTIQKDSATKFNKKEWLESYNGLIETSINTGELENAKKYIQHVFEVADKNSWWYCNNMINEAMLALYQDEFIESKAFFSKSIGCYKANFPNAIMDIGEAYYLSAKLDLLLADYKSAKSKVAILEKVTASYHQQDSGLILMIKKIKADIEYEKGDYKSARTKYKEIYNNYNFNNNLETYINSGINLAILEHKFGNYERSQIITNAIIPKINSGIISNKSIGGINIKSKLAYLHYLLNNVKASDQLYDSSLDLIKETKLKVTELKSKVLNGKGLNFLKKNELNEAEEFFLKSYTISKDVFTENHPSTALVIYHLALVDVEKNQLTKAEESLKKSLSINKNFFNDNHHIIAKIYKSLGDVESKQNNFNKANNYYKKSIQIISELFGENHPTINVIKSEIKN